MQRQQFRGALLLVTMLAISSAVVHAEILPAPERVSAHAWAWIGPHEVPTERRIAAFA